MRAKLVKILGESRIFDTHRSLPINAIYGRNFRWLLKPSRNATNISGYMAVKRNEMSIILENLLDSQTRVHYAIKISSRFFCN